MKYMIILIKKMSNFQKIENEVSLNKMKRFDINKNYDHNKMSKNL